MQEIRFVTLNPGHFHAALVQKEMVERAACRAYVYAPLGADLVAHLSRIAGFNSRSLNPTSWELEVHACADYLERMQREKPGNVVVLAGRNANKIDAILTSLEAGMNVLADKPWILTPEGLPKLQQALDTADEHGLIARDIMTERHEITSLLQREFIRDEAAFGTIVPGSPDEPGVFMESVHYLKKSVAGVPLRRPAWFFDIHQQGEALSDVGTHLVDLAAWLLYPEQAIDVANDVCLMSAKRWPTVLSKSDFQEITGEPEYPSYLHDALDRDELPYFCNTLVNYTLRGVHVKLNVLWDVESTTSGGDTHLAICRGMRSRIEVRQGRAEKYVPELFIIPNKTMEYPMVHRALDHRVQQLQPDYPGIGIVDLGTHFRVSIPQEYRVGHEAHFAQVTKQFVRYMRGQNPLPAWEKPNMLAKYFVTTHGVDLREKPSTKAVHAQEWILHMKQHVKLAKGMSVVVLLLIGTSGCGLSEYEKRMDDQRKRVKEFDDTNKLLDNPIDIPSIQIQTPVSKEDLNPETKIEQAWKFDVFLRLPKGFGYAVSERNKVPYNYPFPCFRYTGGDIAPNFFVAAAAVAESEKDEKFREYTPQNFRALVKQAIEDFLLKTYDTRLQLEKVSTEKAAIKEFSPLSTLPDEPEKTIEYERITYALRNPMNKETIVFQAYFHEAYGKQVCIVVHLPQHLVNRDAFNKSMDACLGSLDVSPLVASRRAHFLKTRRP